MYINVDCSIGVFLYFSNHGTYRLTRLLFITAKLYINYEPNNFINIIFPFLTIPVLFFKTYVLTMHHLLAHTNIPFQENKVRKK